MKSLIFILLFLIGINLFFYPRMIEESLFKEDGEMKLLEKREVLFFAPVWESSYEKKIFSYNNFSKEEAFALGGNARLSIYIPCDANTSKPLVKSAKEIWLRYILLPSIILILIRLVLAFKNQYCKYAIKKKQ
jgi:hypothetical protein